MTSVTITAPDGDAPPTSVETGRTITLAATVTYEDKTTGHDVAWASKDPTIATVADGVVTGVKAGTARISASAGTVTSTDLRVGVTSPANP